MNYTDDSTPRPEPVPGGGAERPYGPARDGGQSQYYADRPGYERSPHQPYGQSGGAQDYRSSTQDGSYGSFAQGESGGAQDYQGASPSGSYGSDRYGSGQYGSSMNGSHQTHQYGPTPPGGTYGPNGPYYRNAYDAPVPREVRKWNWGAFTFNWIWGCGNGAYLALLSLIPVFNIVWVFVCGARGNIWAWKSGKFKDLDTFLTTQRTWSIAGLIYFLINFAGVFFVILAMMAWVPAYSMFDQGGYTDFGDYNWS